MNYTVDAPQDVIDGVKYEARVRETTIVCASVGGLITAGVVFVMLTEEPEFQNFVNTLADYFLK